MGHKPYKRDDIKKGAEVVTVRGNRGMVLEVFHTTFVVKSTSGKAYDYWLSDGAARDGKGGCIAGLWVPGENDMAMPCSEHAYASKGQQKSFRFVDATPMQKICSHHWIDLSTGGRKWLCCKACGIDHPTEVPYNTKE